MHPYFTEQQRKKHEQEMLKLEMEIDQSRWEVARERAEEIVKDMGIDEDDDAYDIYLHEETKRQWDEEYDRYMWKRGMYDHHDMDS